MDTSKQFDLSSEELSRMKRRAEIRQKLKHEYNKLNLNPLRGAYGIDVNDPAVQRFYAARVSRKQHWKPNWKGFAAFILVTIIPTAILSKYYTTSHNKKDLKYRTGEITYEQRTYMAV